MKELSKEKALAKSQAICSKQEKCKADIKQKLYDWKVNPSHHDEILESLVKDRYIDEERYVTFFVRDKFKLNKWGKIKIEYALKTKNISDELIQTQLEKIEAKDYENTCKDLIISKIKLLKKEDGIKTKEKLLRFAHGRGFEPSMVYKIVESLISSTK